jgi:hypothetical protein
MKILPLPKKKKKKVRSENRGLDLTSYGNMVSPPSSTSDKYNKKEAICMTVKIYVTIL